MKCFNYNTYTKKLGKGYSANLAKTCPQCGKQQAPRQSMKLFKPVKKSKRS